MKSTNYAIMGVPKYECRGAASTAPGVTPKELASMLDNDTPTNNSIPYGYCQCGCGEKTNISDRNKPKYGWAKGEPKPYVRGHAQRLRAIPPNPTGRCLCGCGRRASVASRSSAKEGTVAGFPKKYASPGCAGRHSGAKRAASRKVFPHPAFQGAACIPLAGGGTALIDEADVPVVEGRSWHKTRGYVTRSGHRGREYLHRLIMDAPDDMEVDHINRNRLDNRRSNLRLATRSQNQQNKIGRGASGLPRGVCRNGRGYRARISHLGVEHGLGTFDCPIAAARAYDDAAIERHGDFAILNFPESRRAQGTIHKSLEREAQP